MEEDIEGIVVGRKIVELNGNVVGRQKDELNAEYNKKCPKVFTLARFWLTANLIP